MTRRALPITRVHCPTCNCDIARRVVVNPNAPFHQLVLDIDRLLHDRVPA